MGWKTAITALLVGVLGASLAAPWAQSAPSGGNQAAPEGLEALAWDRDFDLILELKNIPSGGQILREARRQALEKEKSELQARLRELQSRLDALQGTYTSEALLNEMLRQGVSDIQSVTKNLNDEMDRTRRRIDDLNQSLKRMAGPGRD